MLYRLIQRMLLYFVRPAMVEFDNDVRAAYGQDLSRVERGTVEIASTLKNNLTAQIDRFHNQLAALQALDVTFQEQGHIIVLAKVNGKDVVKVIRCPSRFSLGEYRTLTQHLEKRYGLGTRRVSAPSGVDPQEFASEFVA